ncbi:hypothetical protein K504DRAFT_517661 [Pleomassaria siparia CBS 279.74]|uniref:Uncharacterized protein n=1 Tax=Pleomassaria siparia CBS 279.74 TaxID=1314801 RepID=A0A6G1KMJ3_9PLEO|nr:hypothetical protein K504DRAFT_517661 [Pleomassaria siparia CBS 279.74]
MAVGRARYQACAPHERAVPYMTGQAVENCTSSLNCAVAKHASFTLIVLKNKTWLSRADWMGSALSLQWEVELLLEWVICNISSNTRVFDCSLQPLIDSRERLVVTIDTIGTIDTIDTVGTVGTVGTVSTVGAIYTSQ